jgi:hypothetical protein
MMQKKMTAKFPGRCAVSGAPIYQGDEITYCTDTRRAWLSEHDDAKVNTVTFNDQGTYRTFSRNAKGRCEDAPCCGCCTI